MVSKTQILSGLDTLNEIQARRLINRRVRTGYAIAAEQAISDTRYQERVMLGCRLTIPLYAELLLLNLSVRVAAFESGGDRNA